MTGYVRDEVALTPWMHLTAGLRRDDVRYYDFASQRDFVVRRWNPLAGIAIRITPSTVVRAAAFRSLSSDFTGAKISPTTVSGFVIARNELPTAIRKETNASIEHAWTRAFLGVRTFVRQTTVPSLADVAFLPEAESHAVGGSAFLNVTASPRLSLFADDQVIRTETRIFDQVDHRVRLGFNFIHERGFFARITTEYITQRFSNTTAVELPKSGFGLTDIDVKQEFAGKRGLFQFTITNLFDRRFDAVVEGLSIERLLPDRRALAQLRWRF